MIQIQGDFFTGGCYKGLVGFAAPRLMSFPDWDLLSVLTPGPVMASPGYVSFAHFLLYLKLILHKFIEFRFTI